MMQSVTAIYDGEKFILDEGVNLTAGQKVIVTILENDDPKYMTEGEINILIKTFSGGGSFNGKEDVDAYINESRADRNF
ncbi:MAG: hypothetical protein IKZ58_08810 [Selenomonadaceae bacterium]|nr:hypothetical protein [Selenomonadaceae bacterium]